MLISADIGEETGCDEDIIPHISVANIACGYHASNPVHMEETVHLAHSHDVKICAHPGYEDRENFGRISIPHTPEEIIDLVTAQVQALLDICIDHQVPIFAIKPHGALYHDMMNDPLVRGAIVTVAKQYDLPLVVQAMTAERNTIDWDTPVKCEVFADRAYTPEGMMLPRSEPNSLHQDADTILAQAERFLNNGSVRTTDHSIRYFNPNTLCFHGDNPASVTALKLLHAQD